MTPLFESLRPDALGDAPTDARSACAVDTFLERLQPVEPSRWPNRLLMEIECINDPAELEAVKLLIDERIAWLRK